MNMLRTYSKLMIVRNYLNYLYVILSIIITYLLVAVLMIYMDNVSILSGGSEHSNLHYIYITIRSIFFLGGFTFIISQYYNIMKSGTKDYCVLKGLGATNDTIRYLIFLQTIFLIFISIPVGLLSGYLLTGKITDFLENYMVARDTLDWINTSVTFYITAGVICCFIISIGIYQERRLRKMPLSKIFLDNTLVGKDG
jgi:Putative GTPases (G3E family)